MPGGEPSHYSMSMEPLELADINFFRDIGPLSR